ncbi:AAA family ATPase [Candidatus Falkowbacteria bacterium]|nr:AAA family ATPase [Candidatus Falkowbacteria bacterium]
MADLLRIRAKNHQGLSWEFVEREMVGYRLELDHPPIQKINDADIYQVELVGTSKEKTRKIATVRLVAKVQELKDWEKITEVAGFWIPKDDLRAILILIHHGTDVILIGEKGTGKTTFSFMLAKTLGWQEPLKVDIGMIKRTSDLFGSDAAHEGSTYFARSPLFDYIERAITAHEKGLESQFIVIFDEINRVHSKSSEGLHGLFDDTRQLTISTSEGGRIINLPPNIHFIGTMNQGANYTGTFEVDEALKDRFIPFKMKPMPIDYEVNKLVQEIGVSEAQALAVAQVARTLRDAANAGQITYAPSYRACRAVARMIKHSMELRMATIKGFLGWYQGDLSFDDKGEVADANAEVAKAFSALRMKGMAKTK